MVSVKIKAIIPKLELPNLQQVITSELRKEARIVSREMGYPTRRWRRRVEFHIEETPQEVTVSTPDKIYGYVDKGTKPHKITAKNAPFLKFKRNFRSKTVPDSLNSRAGASNPPWVTKDEVKHPGTKARGFTKLVLRRSKARFAKNVDKAVRLAVQRANRGVK